MQNKILLSFREGCSGNWLAELILGTELQARYRQDINGSKIPNGVFHFDGNTDFQVINALCKFAGQPWVTCHSTNYELLRQYWPDYKIVRIQPQTHILDSIESAYNKLGKNFQSVDIAFEYIKDYYRLHTVGDRLPEVKNSCVIDYGLLRYPDKLMLICREVFGVELNQDQIKFAKEYWDLQHGKSEVFKVARYIYEYEKQNGYTESDRLWTISEVSGVLGDVTRFANSGKYSCQDMPLAES